MLGNFACLFCRLFFFLFCFVFFLNQLFQKNLSGIPSECKSLDPDQVQCFVGPDLGPNCLQRLSADDESHH